nr:Eukaryotic translation initiation factor 1A [Ipomoea trifida]
MRRTIVFLLFQEYSDFMNSSLTPIFSMVILARFLPLSFRKRGKNEVDDEKRELVFMDVDQEYAQALCMLSNGRCEAMCVRMQAYSYGFCSKFEDGRPP